VRRSGCSIKYGGRLTELANLGGILAKTQRD
jgi:hypothetical protein